MLFVAVALFGLLAYAFMKSSRTSTNWLQSEKTSAEATSALDCTNAIDMATRRLEARGCEGMISLLEDGSNPDPQAPNDGSCSVYNANGGGVKPCN